MFRRVQGEITSRNRNTSISKIQKQENKMSLKSNKIRYYRLQRNNEKSQYIYRTGNRKSPFG